MSQLCWVWLIDPIPPSLIPSENWLHTAAASLLGRDMLMRSTRMYCTCLISAVSMCCFFPAHMHVFCTVFLCANAGFSVGPCWYWRVGVLSYVYMCVPAVCVCVILLREIISSNVHWPDSPPVLGFLRCINILEKSPGETESLCKHNHHESIYVYVCVHWASLSGQRKFHTQYFSMIHIYKIDF